MDANAASATAEIAATMRSLHQELPTEARILDDPIARWLIDPNSDASKARVSFLASLPASLRSRLTNFVMRSRYAEDCLEEAFQRGVRQYVVLGAGLDTFAFRQPSWANSLMIFEVDHPATQKTKIDRLMASGVEIPSNVAFAPVDFSTVSLADGLEARGFNPNVAAFFSLLGVSQYLTRSALESTLGFALKMPKSSEIVLSIVLPEYALPADEAALSAASAARFAAIGEPWLTRLMPKEFTTDLIAMGFEKAVHLEPQDANARYFNGRSDNLEASNTEQMIRAII